MNEAEIQKGDRERESDMQAYIHKKYMTGRKSERKEGMKSSV